MLSHCLVFVLGKSHSFSALIPHHTPQAIVVLRCYLGALRPVCFRSKNACACMFLCCGSVCACVFMCQQPQNCTPKLVCGLSELRKIAFLSSWKMWWNGDDCLCVCVCVPASLAFHVNLILSSCKTVNTEKSGKQWGHTVLWAKFSYQLHTHSESVFPPAPSSSLSTWCLFHLVLRFIVFCKRKDLLNYEFIFNWVLFPHAFSAARRQCYWSFIVKRILLQWGHLITCFQ